MSHVDEGALHAYLDGALDEYPAAEAERVRGHLEQCAECSDRLELERRVREDATAILGMAVPQVAVPTLEELRAYVRSQPPTRTAASIRLYRIGWAASVVLAAGGGWMLRDGQLGPVAAGVGGIPELESRAVSGAPQSRPEQTAALDDAVGGGTREADGIAPAAPLADAPSIVMDVPPAAVEAPAVVADAPAVVRKSADSVGNPGAGAPAAAEATSAVPLAAVAELASERPTPPFARADSLAQREAEARGVEAARGRAEIMTSRLNEAGTVPPAAPAIDPAARLGLSEEATGAAGDSAPGSLVVPGLEVLSIVWREEGLAPLGVQVLQSLENGDTLELIHLPEGVDPSAVGPLDERLSELVVPRQAGWLIMRAPVGAASLAELLRKLDSVR